MAGASSVSLVRKVACESSSNSFHLNPFRRILTNLLSSLKIAEYLKSVEVLAALLRLFAPSVIL